MTLIIGLILAFIVMVGFLIFAWWGVPILIVAGVLFVLLIVTSSKSDVTVERTSKEPADAPRAGRSGGAGTANKRVGQQ
jgi:hypothetical protein